MNRIKILNGKFTAKMVRERWFNHLDPNIDKGSWKADEDIRLVETTFLLNFKWC
jgi:hypothetical protein